MESGADSGKGADTGAFVSFSEVVFEGGGIFLEAEVIGSESSGLSVGVESVVRRMVECGCDLDAVTEVVVERLIPCQSFEGDISADARSRLDAPESGVLYVGTGQNEELAAAFRERP